MALRSDGAGRNGRHLEGGVEGQLVVAVWEAVQVKLKLEMRMSSCIPRKTGSRCSRNTRSRGAGSGETTLVKSSKVQVEGWERRRQMDPRGNFLGTELFLPPADNNFRARREVQGAEERGKARFDLFIGQSQSVREAALDWPIGTLRKDSLPFRLLTTGTPHANRASRPGDRGIELPTAHQPRNCAPRHWSCD